MLVGGAPMTIPLPMSQCIVPEGINGPVALFVTSDGQPLLNNVRDRAQNKVIAGPALAFIDTKPQMLGQLARGSATGAGSGSSNQASTSTRTISPAEASSIIVSAGAATATDSSAAAPTATSASSTSGDAASSGASSSGPNLFTGKSPDGKITVNGWKGA